MVEGIDSEDAIFRSCQSKIVMNTLTKKCQDRMLNFDDLSILWLYRDAVFKRTIVSMRTLKRARTGSLGAKAVFQGQQACCAVCGNLKFLFQSRVCAKGGEGGYFRWSLSR